MSDLTTGRPGPAPDRESTADDRLPSAPVTGVDQIDEATARLAALADSPLAEHQNRLAEAQLALHEALHGDDPPEG